MIRYVDDQMNRVHMALAERGLLENTWMVFASDHGDFMGEKGLFEKCEVPYECLTHVPLVIRPPTNMTARRGIRVPGLVDLVDLFPTFLSLAGIPVPEYAQGRDLMSWVGNGARRPLRRFVFAQVGDYHGHLKSTFPTGTFSSGRRNALVRAGRSREFSYINDPQCGDEAYDLTRDPRELDNLLQGTSVPDGAGRIKDEIFRWEETCLDLRRQLNVIPGDRGFEPGWE
jgi:arylsulfatase A-like enzyme